MKVTCDIIKDLLPLYCDNVSSKDTNKLIENHIAKCSDCKKVLQNMQEKLETVNSKDEISKIDFIKKTSKNWKRDKLKSLLKGILIAIIIMLILSLFVGIKIS